MKILLYKPGSPTAFRKYNNSEDVVIPPTRDEVHIQNICDAGIEVEKFRLVRVQPPMWTDETKNNLEIMVKITVEEMEGNQE